MCRSRVLFAGVLVWMAPCFAGVVNLNFSSLPSAQGWTFDTNASCTQGSMFSVSGGALYQDTLSPSCGDAGTVWADYSLGGVVASTPYTIAVTAKVTADQVYWPDDYMGFGFWAVGNGEAYYVGMGVGYVEGLLVGGTNDHSAPVAVDTSYYRNYLLSVTPGVGYTLSVDGSVVLTGAPYPDAGNYLGLGDGTGGADAAGVITAYEYSSVPEPGTLLLAAAGAALIARRRFLPCRSTP